MNQNNFHHEQFSSVLKRKQQSRMSLRERLLLQNIKGETKEVLFESYPK